MKSINKKIIWSIILGLLGIVLLIISLFGNAKDATITGFALGITGVAIAKLIQFYRISRNPKLLKKYEIYQKEERAISIAEKSGRFTFLLTIFVEFIAIFVLILINQSEIASIVSYITSIQVVVYLIIYYYLSKKY